MPSNERQVSLVIGNTVKLVQLLGYVSQAVTLRQME